MPHEAKREKMTADEFWEHVDRDLSQVLVGVSPAFLVVSSVLAAVMMAAWLLLT